SSSDFSPPRAFATSRNLPSGDHDGLAHAAEKSAIFCSCPPNGEIRYIPLPFFTKAICFPSGDQAGERSVAVVWVSWRAVALPMIFTYKFQLSSFPGLKAK